MEITKAVEEYLYENKPTLAFKTYRYYTYHLNRFTNWCAENQLTELSQITTALVHKAVECYGEPYSYTRHGYVRVVKSFLRWCAVEENYGVRLKTVERIKLPRVNVPQIEIFTPEDVDNLIEATYQMPFPRRAKAIVCVLLDTGIRATELCRDPRRPEEQTGLLLENVFLDREGGYLKVVGKGNKTRTIGFGVTTASAIRRYLDKERYKDEEDIPYLFLSRKRMGLSNNQLNHFMGELGEVSGVPNCYPHRFRHTFAVNKLLNGTPELELMYLMGHNYLESTSVYVRGLKELRIEKTEGSVIDKFLSKKRR